MGDASGPRVLVVDDASLVRLYYREILEAAGFSVDEALNGIEALETLLARNVDLLIVDVNMPRMDGMTFLRALRRQPLPLGATPAIMASTEAGPQDISAATEAGANAYLIKPVSAETLTAYALALTGDHLPSGERALNRE